MIVNTKTWQRYINALRKLSDKAMAEMQQKIEQVGMDTDEAMRQLVDYGYALATKYGEGSAALAAEMYDALAELSGEILPAALPAATAKYGEVAKAVYGTALQSKNPEVMSGAIGRLVKMAGADTMQQNAIRDHAEWAWIPSGETCAFCLAIASRGWQPASKKALKGGHAEHIHANCDCTYAIRFSPDLNIGGYDPDKYKEMYDDAEGKSSKDKINYMRRQFYKENSEEINEQKRSAYEKQKEREESSAEEYDVD